MLTLVFGGASSGKSRYALELARESGDSVVFVATCVPRDEEMRDKVARHKLERPTGWTTVEAPSSLTAVLTEHQRGARVLLLDCLTLYLSDALIKGASKSSTMEGLERFCRQALQSPMHVIVVSNEVGFGIVPESSLGRSFRDLAGSANQLVANLAHEVFFVVAGIAMPLKRTAVDASGNRTDSAGRKQ